MAERTPQTGMAWGGREQRKTVGQAMENTLPRTLAACNRQRQKPRRQVLAQAGEAPVRRNPEGFKEAAAHYPLGRMLRPEDGAEAVGFLASPLASAISGICLPVDCGLSAGIPALARTFTQSGDY